MEVISYMLGCSLLGFVTSLGILALALRLYQQRRLTDRCADFHHNSAPEPEAAPVPRFGGIGLAVAFVILICLPFDSLFGIQSTSLRWVIAGSTLAMFGLGFWDDLHPVGAKVKLAGQILIASAAFFGGLEIDTFKIPYAGVIIQLGWLAWPATVLWLVAMTNLINLIDGVDGLAGGIALMLMLLLCAVGGCNCIIPFVAAGMAGALLGFLRYNLPPARIYLGDGGAFMLGFLVAALTIRNSHKGTVAAALIAPLFVLALPILDTSLALMRRGFHGLPLFRPDRRHLHHRLLESGLSRWQVILGAYAFTAFFLVLGLLAFWWEGRYDAIVLGLATLALLLVARRFGFSREWFAVFRVLNNSLKARADIQYALAQSRWLAMEGERGRDLQTICEDTAFVARKIGFAAVRIHLCGTEKNWMTAAGTDEEECRREMLLEKNTHRQIHEDGDHRSHVYQHRLPGHRDCWIEFQTPDLDAKAGNGSPLPLRPKGHHSKIGILAELLAEAWAKSTTNYARRNGNTLRFPSEADKKIEMKQMESATH